MANEDSTPPAKCLHCQTQLVSPIFCTGCQTLYPPHQATDYFDLLGLPRQYAIDEARLTSAFRAIARNIHPDRFADQPAEVRALATRISAEVNRAVEVLRDPVQRAAYLLVQAHGPSAADAGEVPGDLLAEVIMLREEIETARSDNDTQALERVRKTVEARRAETVGRIPALANRLATSSEEDKRTFRQLLNSIKYFDNLSGELASDPLARPAGAGDG